MRVHHSGDDEEARAVDPLGALGRTRDDAALGDGDVGAAEFARADVYQPVSQDELGYRPLTVATSAIAPSGTGSASAWRLKPRAARVFGRTRAMATPTM